MAVHESVLQDENDSSRLWHFVAIFVALVGFLISLYSVYHFRLVASLGQSGAACNVNGHINCDLVAASTYGRFLTIPLGVWGAAYFFTILLLLACSLKRYGNRQEHLLVYTICVGLGLLATLGLAFVSFRILGLACLICMGIYAVNLLQVGILWFGFKRKHIVLGPLSFSSLNSGLVNAVIGFAIVLVTYNIIGEQDLKQNGKVPPKEVSHAEVKVHSIPISLNAYSGLGEDYRKGPDDAKVKLVIFSDFQCPACNGVSNLIEEIYQSFPGKILLVYRNYPLDQSCNPALQHKMHEYACLLASLARCAGNYGKFWAYHDLVFAKQSELNSKSPVQWAKDVGLNDAQVTACLSDKSIADKIKEDVDLGTSLGIDATPTIYLNGVRFSRHPQELKNEVKRLTEQ